MVETAAGVREMLIEVGKQVSLVNVRFISPMDEEILHRLAVKHTIWVTLEENVKSGGFGEKVASFLSEQGYNQVKYLNISLPNQFIAQGDVRVLKEKLGMDMTSIFRKVLDL
jgi:1-deoxy-D-xylulose-5-phosphate synthase